jgi:hypothetical protein
VCQSAKQQFYFLFTQEIVIRYPTPVTELIQLPY